MKNLLSIPILIFISTVGYSQAEISLIETVYDFDTIQQYGNVSHDFGVVNTGNEPLIITNARTSCGCDVSNWYRAPIMPGDTAYVNYKYDSKRIGLINKSMTILSNDTITPSIVVRVKGRVTPLEDSLKKK